MFVPVKLAINIRVFDSKISAEIDNTRARSQQRFGKFGGKTMR